MIHRNFFIAVIRHFIKSDCSSRAENLTFSTLLSLVPLLTVFFGILTLFHGFSQFSVLIENFIFTHFLPTTGNILQNYFHNFIKNALTLSSLSLIFLLVVAIKMIFIMEESFDVIWEIKKKRTLLSAIILYGTTLLLLPILLGIGLLLISYFSPLFSSTAEMIGIKKILLASIPALSIFFIFSLLYMALPHAKVKLKFAVCGAFLTTGLFEILKHSFEWYIHHFTSYELLYGSLSVVPIFLIWIYFLWIIILLGATCTYIFQKANTPLE